MPHSNPEEVKAKLISILKQLTGPERQLFSAVLNIEKENLYLKKTPHIADELVAAVKRIIV